MPNAALSFEQQILSIFSAEFKAQKDALLSTESRKLARRLLSSKRFYDMIRTHFQKGKT
jgi:hypothetical protein